MRRAEPFGILDMDKPESFGVHAVGLLSYTGIDREGISIRKDVRFVADVPIVFPQLGAPFRETGSYDAMLQVNGNKYDVVVPISHALKSGEVDRFHIRIGAKMSSVHKLQAKIVMNNGQELISTPVIASLLVPRSNAADMELQKKPLQSTPSK
jgi:hypothetical protein